MTITKEGSLASFYTVNKAPIKHLRVYFSPKQSGSGDPSSQNIRPINGQNQISIFNTSNIVQLKIKNFTSTTSNGITSSIDDKGRLTFNGTTTAATAFTYSIEPIIINKVTNLILLNTNIKTLSGNQCYIGLRYNGTNIASCNMSQIDFYNDAGCRINVDKEYQIDEIRFIFSAGISNLSCLPFIINDTNINKNICSFNQTIYGGYVDLITGELVQEYRCIDLNTLSFNYLENINLMSCKTFTSEYDCKIPKYNSSFAEAIAEKYKLVLATVTEPQSGDFFISTSGNLVIFSDIQPTGNLVYKINTPITYQLTPRQITTLIGCNNIWSNADRVEIEYDLAESNDELYRRRNIILQSAPHLETTSGDIANFNTDIIAPIKDAKIYFNPVQEGSGDPSPTNIQTIDGWDNLNININNNTINIDWSLTSGTIYGGYIDLISGKLVQTHYKLVFDGTEKISMTYAKTEDQFLRVQYVGTDVPKIQQGKLNEKQNTASCKYSHGKYEMSNTNDMSKGGAASNRTQTSTVVLIHLPIEIYTSGDVISDVKNYLATQYNNGTPVELCYELQNPIEYQLTPQQLKALKGTNNIWSNANGPVEISYWTH